RGPLARTGYENLTWDLAVTLVRAAAVGHTAGARSRVCAEGTTHRGSPPLRTGRRACPPAGKTSLPATGRNVPPRWNLPSSGRAGRSRAIAGAPPASATRQEVPRQRHFPSRGRTAGRCVGGEA